MKEPRFSVRSSWFSHFPKPIDGTCAAVMQMCELFTSARSVLRIHTGSWIQLRNICSGKWKKIWHFIENFLWTCSAGSISYSSHTYQNSVPPFIDPMLHYGISNNATTQSPFWTVQKSCVVPNWRRSFQQSEKLSRHFFPGRMTLRATWEICGLPTIWKLSRVDLLKLPACLIACFTKFWTTPIISVFQMISLGCTKMKYIMLREISQIGDLGIHWKRGRRFGGHISSILREVVIYGNVASLLKKRGVLLIECTSELYKWIYGQLAQRI